MFTTWQLLAAEVGIGILAVAALAQVIVRRVPNVLTLPAILAGWAFAAYVDANQPALEPAHALQASLLGTFLALAIMWPFFYTQRLGAGCVKAQMAFAAWAGVACRWLLRWRSSPAPR